MRTNFSALSVLSFWWSDGTAIWQEWLESFDSFKGKCDAVQDFEKVISNGI